MSYSHEVRVTVTPAGQPIAKTNVYSANASIGLDETLPGGAATVFTLDIDVSALVSLVMLCDRDVAITVNDDGTPDATINLKAGVPLVWTNDGYYANPLGSVDVTSFKATLASGADAALRLEAIYDPTP